jgi:hypothetical protein
MVAHERLLFNGGIAKNKDVKGGRGRGFGGWTASLASASQARARGGNQV